MRTKNWMTWAVILFVCAAILVGVGFYKMNVYNYNEYSSKLSKNAYVGGDAYNYIINSNYATGYFVLGGFSFMSAIVLLVGRSIVDRLDMAAKKHGQDGKATQSTTPSGGSKTGEEIVRSFLTK